MEVAIASEGVTSQPSAKDVSAALPEYAGYILLEQLSQLCIRVVLAPGKEQVHMVRSELA